MAVNHVQLADEIAAALGHPGNVTVQVLGFAKGILEELTQNGVATFGFVASGHTISGMVDTSMASKIANYAGYGFVTPQLEAYCRGIVLHIQSMGIVTYVGPIFPPPPPPGWYLGGTISGLSGSDMADKIKTEVGFPNVSAQLLAKCTAIADHIMNNAQVVSGVIS